MVHAKPGTGAPSPSDRLRSYADFGDVDLKEALLTLWRRKWLIIAITLAVAGSTAAVVSSLTPLYTASVKLLFDDQRINLLPGLVTQTQATEQVEVIASRAVARRVIDRMDLRVDAEFNPELQPETALARSWRSIRNLDWRQLDFAGWVSRAIGSDLEVLRAPEADAPAGEREVSDALRSRLLDELIVESFLERVAVEAVPSSNVIEIAFVSEEPTKAAAIADQIAEMYLEQRLEAKFAEIQRNANWLNTRIAELRQEVADAEAAVEEYRRQTGLAESSRGGEGAAQQANELNTQLILARTERAEREARRDQVRRLLQSGPEGLSSAIEVLDSALINDLMAKEIDLKREVADLAQVYGARHPQLLNAQAELEDLREKIRLEATRVAESLQAEVNVARERERLLEQGLQQIETAIYETNEASVTLRALEREANAARTLLETFLQQSQELRSQDDLGFQRADASIISAAAVPRFPTYPKKTLAVLAAAVVGGLIGVVTALLTERFEAVFRGAEQIEEALGLPVLAAIPDLRKVREVRKKGLANYVMQRPNTAAAEAIRALNGRMLLAPAERGATVQQIISAEPEEGKSSLAVASALMHARGGRRVLLIDADFRQSQVAEQLRLAPMPGLIEVMAGRATLEEALRREPVTGMSVLTSGRFVPTAHDLIIGGRLAKLLEQVRGDYDMIVIDSPPVLSIADGLSIARLVDGVIFVARWGKTRKPVVTYALKQLTASGATISGVVMSFVDLKRAARYSYGDAGRYYGKHQKYYLDDA